MDGELIELFRVLDGWSITSFPSQQTVHPGETLAQFERYQENNNLIEARRVLEAEILRLRPSVRMAHLGAISEVRQAGPQGFDVGAYVSHLHSLVAGVRVRENGWDDARTHLLHGLAVAPHSKEPHHGLVQVYVELGEFESAIAQLDSVIRGDKFAAAMMFDLGSSIEWRREFAAARECYQRVVASDACGLMAELASRRLERLGHRGNDPPQLSELKALSSRATEQLVRGDIPAALDHFLRVLSWSPRHSGTWFGVGYIYQQRMASQEVALMDEGQQPVFAVTKRTEARLALKRAAQAYELAVRYAPELAEAHHQLANCYCGLDLLPMALAAARKAAELEPSSSPVLSDLGGILVANDDLDEAELVCTKAASIDPNDRIVQWHLARILSRRGKRNEADRHSARQAQAFPGAPITKE